MVSVTSLLCILSLCILPAVSTYVTMPLYIDPSNNKWASLFSAISANPSLTFNLIINPESGPGSSTYPDEETIAGLAQLNTYPNVHTLGYVHVDWCSRSLSDVQAEVNTYANWKSYTAKDIHVSGIFFDEAPADYSASSFSYMQTASGYVKSAFPSGQNQVSFNPGATTHQDYFSLADTICQFEASYDQFSDNTLSSIPADQKAASTIIIYGFAGSQAQQSAIVQLAASSGIAGLYVTASNGYTDFSDMWSPFVESMASVAGGGPGPASPPSSPPPSSSSSASASTPSPNPSPSPKPSNSGSGSGSGNGYGGSSSGQQSPSPSPATPQQPSPPPTQPSPSLSPSPSYQGTPPKQYPAPYSPPEEEPETTTSTPTPAPTTPPPSAATSPPLTLTVVPIPAYSYTSTSSTSTRWPRPTRRPGHRYWTRPQHSSDD
jgi:hypothetical protein